MRELDVCRHLRIRRPTFSLEMASATWVRDLLTSTAMDYRTLCIRSEERRVGKEGLTLIRELDGCRQLRIRRPTFSLEMASATWVRDLLTSTAMDYRTLCIPAGIATPRPLVLI